MNRQVTRIRWSQITLSTLQGSECYPDPEDDAVHIVTSSYNTQQNISLHPVGSREGMIKSWETEW
jgi:hypothetical protein